MAADIWVDAVDGRPAQTKALAATVNLTDNGGAGTSWLWSVVDAPPGTTAAFSSAVAPAPTYGPLDQPGSYMIRLQVDGATGDWHTTPGVDQIVIRVASVNLGLWMPALGETDEGGVSGWADWISGMNNTLGSLDALFTLQGVYNNSAPPQIAIDPARGPVALFRNSAVATPILIGGDSGLATRFTLQSDGRLALTGKLDSAGEFLVDLYNDAAAHADAYMLRMRDQTGLGSLLLSRDFQLVMVSDGIANGPRFELRGAPAHHLLDVERVGPPNPIHFRVDPLGAVLGWSDGADYGIDFDALSPALGLVRVRDSAGSGGDPIDLVVDADGGLILRSKGAATGLAVDAKASVFIAYLQNTTLGSSWALESDGQIVHAADLAGFDVMYDFLPIGFVAASPIIRIFDGVNPGWQILADGRTFHMPEELIGNADASVSWHHMNLTRMATVLNGETRRGFFLDGSAATINAGGTLIGVDSQLRANSGVAACYRAVVDVQDTIRAYACQTAAGLPFRAFDRFCVADIGLTDWDTVNALTPTGGATNIVSGGATRYILIPVHVPHGATITGYSVHVNAGAAGLAVYLIRTDATTGGDADQQTRVGTASAGAAGEQDLGQAGLAEVVPLQNAAAQFAYSIVIYSFHLADTFYSGEVVYTHNQITKGD